MDTLGKKKKLAAMAVPIVDTSKTLTKRTTKSIVFIKSTKQRCLYENFVMGTKEEIEHIVEMMHKHEDKATLLSQLQAMLNDARQRMRQRQYEEYFSNRK